MKTFIDLYLYSNTRYWWCSTVPLQTITTSTMMMTIYLQSIFFHSIYLCVWVCACVFWPLSHPVVMALVYFIREHKRLLIYIKFLSDVGLHYTQRELFHTCEYARWSLCYSMCICLMKMYEAKRENCCMLKQCLTIS